MLTGWYLQSVLIIFSTPHIIGLKTEFLHFRWFSVIVLEIIYFPKNFIDSHTWNKFQ